MSCTILHMEQRTPEWLAARCGRVTASRAKDVLAMSKKGGGELAARRDYRMELALERIFGRPMESGYQNDDMRRGVELEPLALNAYEAREAVFVRRTGFILHDELPIGVSLDGDLDNLTGLVEAKAPRPANHWAYLEAGVVPPDYLPQLVHGQLVTGAQWTDFVSFCPDFGPLALFVVRYERDEAAIASYRLMLEQFLAEVEKEEAAIRVRLDAAAVAA